MIGWGLTSDGGKGSEVLLEVELPIVSLDTANATGAYDTDLTADMIPAGFAEGGKDSCQGDSGGPFVVRMDDGEWGSAGVVSFGSSDGCAAPNAHGVYANVPYFSIALWAGCTRVLKSGDWKTRCLLSLVTKEGKGAGHSNRGGRSS